MENKPYLVIARKYRPQGFESVVGQEAVVTTLKNAIAHNRTGHAYLFTGPRGVGKTSMARIFAKALLCKNGPTVEPCGKCQPCLEIEQGRSLDVMEIDGASNRGIDEIRALRENVKFSPASGKFKIYIIDEVHQITTDAFNALLKTLEEPPAYVKFVFATTSSQKVPATIVSRCQRFDFRRIPLEKIVATLKDICKSEKIKIDEEALYVVARAGDGSLRDSESILDQIASASTEKITKKDVTASLGALEDEKLVELAESLAKRDAKSALELLDSVLAEGKDPALFLEKFLEHVRNLLFLHVSDGLADLIDAGESYKKLLQKQKSLFTKDELFYFFTVTASALQALRRFEMKRIPIEMALVKLAHRAPMEGLGEALRLLKEEKKTPVAESAPAPRAAAPSPRPSTPPPAPRPARAAVVKEEEEAPEIEELPSEDVEIAPRQSAPASLESVWHPLLGAVKAEKISVASYLAEGEPVGWKNGVVTVAFPQRFNFHRETLEMADNKRLIEKHLTQLLGQEARLEFQTVKEVSGKFSTAPADAPPPTPQMNDALKSAMNMFGGRVVGQ